MNRLGSGSNWLTRCCCFENSWFGAQLIGGGKKINLGLSLSVRKFEFLAAGFTLELTPTMTRLTGLVSGHGPHGAFPASPVFTVYPWDGMFEGSPAQHIWRLTIRQLLLAKEDWLCRLTCTKPTYFLETGAPPPLAVLAPFTLPLEAFLNIL